MSRKSKLIKWLGWHIQGIDNEYNDDPELPSRWKSRDEFKEEMYRTAIAELGKDYKFIGHEKILDIVDSILYDCEYIRIGE